MARRDGTPTLRQRLRLNLGPLPLGAGAELNHRDHPLMGAGGLLVVAAYPAKQECSTRSRSSAAVTRG